MTTKIHCYINPSNDSDRKCTTDWLASSGLWDHKELGPCGKKKEVEIELQSMPSVLSHLSLIEPEFMLTRISPFGVVLYLTDVIFCGAKNGFGKTMINAKCADGSIFIPMSNIICINFFVGLSPA